MQLLHVDLGGPSGAFAQGYLHEEEPSAPQRPRPCVVVCPGGGYTMVSGRENEPVALAFFAAGYQVFALTYSVGDQAARMQPLRELAALVAKVRRHADAWFVSPDRIAVIGFSAGGHLAASLGTLWNHPALREGIHGDPEEWRPDALMLCYPVITAGERAHRGSICQVSGGEKEKEGFFSLEKQVTSQTPPTFLWHTSDDPVVPVENSLLFAMALRQQGIPFECHIFAHGDHGLSLCNAQVGTPNAQCAPWLPLCLTWLGERFGFSA